MSERKAGGFEQGNRRVRTREFGGIGEGVEHKMKEKEERGSGLVRERRSRSAGNWEVSWREGKKRARDKIHYVWRHHEGICCTYVLQGIFRDGMRAHLLTHTLT